MMGQMMMASSVTTAAAPAVDSRANSLLDFEAADGSTTITDRAAGGRIWTAISPASISTTTPLTGTSSLKLSNGTQCGYVWTNNQLTPFNARTGDFRVEFQFKSPSVGPGTEDYLFELHDANGYQLQIWVNSSGQIVLAIADGDFFSNSALYDNIKHWITYERINGSGTIYVDGAVAVQHADAHDYNAATAMYLGAGIGGTHPSRGVIDEFRFVVGTNISYGGPFTPSAVAFPTPT